MINDPRLNVMNTSANPLMIIGIVLFCLPFVMNAFNSGSHILSYVLFIIGGILFVVGLMMFVAENA